ncbi:hypothetical protein EYF80_014863 [Liparis tanakae]|uniref:Uncharacterized protein n=1 Tax=Liparis tanakae TaxID=230148 RepID=A0A4Z2IBW2_9TELE|nr:hypothetical protein EYF80_014863 [Liparis tanakae]
MMAHLWDLGSEVLARGSAARAGEQRVPSHDPATGGSSRNTLRSKQLLQNKSCCTHLFRE